MVNKLKLIILIVASLQYVSSSDVITKLPGLDQQPSFKQYSGYLDASDNKKFHYWFVESQNKPSSDPLVVWLNGGPGCSSIDGLLSEHGPWTINNDGETLRSNPYSWNKITNVLYMESPAGVGYSYDTTNELATNDKEVAQNNYDALLDFMEKYPQFAQNDFYLTGESYAGFYLPPLAIEILNGGKINLKGLALGNGIMSEIINNSSAIFYGYYHGLFGTELWEPLSKYCCNNNATADTCEFFKSTSGSCFDAVDEALQYIYHSGLNYYSLFHDCYGGNTEGLVKRYAIDMKLLFGQRNTNVKTFLKQIPSQKSSNKFLRAGNGQIPECINTTASMNYMNKPDVRNALHIPDHLPDWSACNIEVTNHYTRIWEDMFRQYDEILQRDDFRVLIYNGDTDMAVNFMGNEWVVDRMKLKRTHSRIPWYVEGQVAGFHKIFQYPTYNSTLHYTTIRGAGHLAPQDQPQKVFAMYESFINNKAFPDL